MLLVVNGHQQVLCLLLMEMGVTKALKIQMGNVKIDSLSVIAIL